MFLAGDAATSIRRSAGTGSTPGSATRVDLGWKLAAVLRAGAAPALLDSYEIERRPVQTRVIEAAVANMRVLASELRFDDLGTAGPAGEDARRAAHTRIQSTKDAEFHALDLVLDIAYESPVIAAGGARLRHAWLDDGRSLYDALGDGFSLLRRGDEDVTPIADAARAAGVPLRVVELRDRGGLELVRPDQHVAWHGDVVPADPRALIDQLRGSRISVTA